jgi:hypothetical protein
MNKMKKWSTCHPNCFLGRMDSSQAGGIPRARAGAIDWQKKTRPYACVSVAPKSDPSARSWKHLFCIVSTIGGQRQLFFFWGGEMR